MKIYLSGPMSGLPHLNKKAFDLAEITVKKKYPDAEIINPHNLVLPGASWRDAMNTDIKALTDCTHIYMLKGYKGSKGALLELTIARGLNIFVMYEPTHGRRQCGLCATQCKIPDYMVCPVEETKYRHGIEHVSHCDLFEVVEFLTAGQEAVAE